jgi:hypothetical protein
MVLKLRRRRTAPAGPADPAGPGRRVLVVHRIGAAALGLFLLVFGALGLAGGAPFVSTSGEQVLGLYSNGLLDVISILMALVLLAAALRGPRIASTVMMVAGALFLLSGLVNLTVLATRFNILAFRLSNVLFSLIVGVVLLVLGAYGRVSGNLPADSPYAHAREAAATPRERAAPTTPEEVAAERAMEEAELAVVMGSATPEQRRRVESMARVHGRSSQRRVWLSFDHRP